jgi:hypothetical protein
VDRSGRRIEREEDAELWRAYLHAKADYDRNGANDAEVADLLGDKSEAMGKHYTQHVTREDNVIRAFERVEDRKP